MVRSAASLETPNPDATCRSSSVSKDEVASGWGPRVSNHGRLALLPVARPSAFALRATADKSRRRHHPEAASSFETRGHASRLNLTASFPFIADTRQLEPRSMGIGAG